LIKINNSSQQKYGLYIYLSKGLLKRAAVSLITKIKEKIHHPYKTPIPISIIIANCSLHFKKNNSKRRNNRKLKTTYFNMSAAV